MRVRRHEEESAEVQMGPLMDCVFLLLIFFIVIAVTKKSIKELGIVLPQSAAAEKVKPKEKDLTIRITGKGDVYIGPNRMSQNMWVNAIRDYALNRPDGKVRLEVDRSTQMVHLIPVIDQVKHYGLKTVGLRTQME